MKPHHRTIAAGAMIQLVSPAGKGQKSQHPAGINVFLCPSCPNVHMQICLDNGAEDLYVALLLDEQAGELLGRALADPGTIEALRSEEGGAWE